MTTKKNSNEKIHVMQCRSTYTTGGGPDKTTLLIAERSDPNRFSQTLLYMRGANDTDFQIGNWARAKGLKIFEVLEYKKLDLSNILETKKIIKKEQIDILHTRDYKTCVVGYLATLFNPNIKLLFTAHLWQDRDSLKMKFYTWLNLLVLKRYHRVIAVSQALKDYMIRRGVPEKKITVIHNAIDTDEWQKTTNTSAILNNNTIPTEANIVGVVGRLRYEKDLHTTLKVAAETIKAVPSTHFLIIGNGPDKKELEQYASHLGIDKNVHFMGFQRDTKELYNIMDFFLSTARVEGMPNTALEAMAMEAPVLYTEVGGVNEIITDGHDGLLFQTGDVKGISKALITLLNNPDRAKEIGKNGRETVCEKFSLTKRLQAVEAVYEALAEDNR